MSRGAKAPGRGVRRVAIIGAGPAGLQTALHLRSAGLEPIVFEEHGRIGAHKLCAGLISRRGAEELGLDLSECLQTSVRGARLYSPDGTMLQVERSRPVAHVVDRRLFDQSLLKKARAAGISVCTATRLVGRDDEALVLRSDGRTLRWGCDCVVGADGAGSTTARLFGLLPGDRPPLRSAQVECEGTYDPHFVEVHLGNFARGFFGWLIPIDNHRAKVGLAAVDGDDCRTRLRRLISDKGLGTPTHRIISGAIPFGPPLLRVASGSAALVGDAAFHTKATSGGGIVFGMRSAGILARCIAQAAHAREATARYAASLAGLHRELLLHWKIRSWYNGLRDMEVDALFARLKKAGVEEFLSERGDMDAPSLFLPRLAASPRFWFMGGSLLVILFSQGPAAGVLAEEPA